MTLIKLIKVLFL